MKKICVLIPTYNESAAIGGVIKAVAGAGFDVTVIDDGSRDATASIARSHGANVLENARNMGKGASLVKGFAFALKNGYDAVITMDGDGQHLAAEAPLFLTAFAQDPGCGIIVGNRMARPGSMPIARVVTNTVMSRLLSAVCRQDIPDTQCGYRLISKTLLEKIELKTSKYETESEMLVQASRLGFRVRSIPVSSVYRDERSSINPFVDTLRFIRFIIRNLK